MSEVRKRNNYVGVEESESRTQALLKMAEAGAILHLPARIVRLAAILFIYFSRLKVKVQAGAWQRFLART